MVFRVHNTTAWSVGVDPHSIVDCDACRGVELELVLATTEGVGGCEGVGVTQNVAIGAWLERTSTSFLCPLYHNTPVYKPLVWVAENLGKFSSIYNIRIF